MAMRIRSQSAMNGNRQLKINSGNQRKTVEKLSSGFRINRAADDASGLAISEKMRRQIGGLTQGVRNVQDGVSLCQVADAALTEVHDMLNRISELSIKAANGTMSKSDRQAVQDEVSMLTMEISRIGTTTTFNDIHIFDYANGEYMKETLNMDLIRSPSAQKGYLSEAYYENGLYYPSASMDFSALTDASKIARLAGKSFSFTCSQSCPEAFTFTFVNRDGQQSRFLNPESKGNRVEHRYQIDLMGIETGEELLNTLFDFVNENPATDGKVSEDRVHVSHSNILIKKSNNMLVLRATTYGQDTVEKVLQHCEARYKNSQYGQADFAGIASASDERVTNVLSIHYGADGKDNMGLYIEKMNAVTLGLNDLKVTLVEECYSAINKAKEAMEAVSRQRSLIGAQQNRLESTIDNENNVIENLTASESRIRDADMAREVVRESTLHILEQAGYSVLAQANQENQSVLALFGG